MANCVFAGDPYGRIGWVSDQPDDLLTTGEWLDFQEHQARAVHAYEVLVCGNPDPALIITGEIRQLIDVDFKHQSAASIVALQPLLHGDPQVSRSRINGKV